MLFDGAIWWRLNSQLGAFAVFCGYDGMILLMPWWHSLIFLFRWFLESMNHDFQYFVTHYLCGFYQFGLA